jgi:peroxiredoxin
VTEDQGELPVALDAAEADFIKNWMAGPQVTRWESVPVQRGDPAPPFVLPDQQNEPVALADVVAGGPAAVIFWRHFGCGCGGERASRLRGELDDFRAAGIGVVVIGQGVPVQAAAYAEAEGLDVPILTDADLSVYRAYGLLDATLPQVLFDAPEWLWSHSEETAEAFVQARRQTARRLVNNPWVLPGEFVVAPDGTIRHVHRYQHCEDYPDHRVLITAATGTALAG